MEVKVFSGEGVRIFSGTTTGWFIFTQAQGMSDWVQEGGLTGENTC